MKTVQILVRRVPEADHRRIKAAAAMNGQTLRDFVVQTLIEKVQQKR